MYFNQNINNCAPGRKLIFLGFRGHRPAVAAFTLEKFDDGVMRISEILHVSIHHRPNTRRGYHRTKAWARRRVLDMLNLRQANGEQAEMPNTYKE